MMKRVENLEDPWNKKRRDGYIVTCYLPRQSYNFLRYEKVAFVKTPVKEITVA